MKITSHPPFFDILWLHETEQNGLPAVRPPPVHRFCLRGQIIGASSGFELQLSNLELGAERIPWDWGEKLKDWRRIGG